MGLVGGGGVGGLAGRSCERSLFLLGGSSLDIVHLGVSGFELESVKEGKDESDKREQD